MKKKIIAILLVFTIIPTMANALPILPLLFIGGASAISWFSGSGKTSLEGKPSSHYAVFENDVNLLQAISDPINTAIVQTQGVIFSAASNLLNGKGGIFYWVVGISILIWAVNRMKNGYPTREEMFKAGAWIVWALFIIAIYSSPQAYQIFASWFNIPASWVYDTIMSAMNIPSDVLTKNLTYFVNKTIEVPLRMYDEAVMWENSENKSGGILGTLGITGEIGKAASAVKVGLWILPTWFTTILILFVLIGIISIMVVSGVVCNLLMAVSPLVVALLMIDKTKPYFYSWLKTYISYTLYLPIGMFVLLIINNYLGEYFGATAQTGTNGTSQLLEWYKNDWQLAKEYKVMIISVFGIFILKKIPSWISQIIGVQGLESGGTTAGGAVASAATGAAGLAAGGAIASRLAGGSAFMGAAKALGSQIPGAKTLQSAYSGIKNRQKAKNESSQLDKIEDKLNDSKQGRNGALVTP